MISHQRWYWALDYFNNQYSCTVAKFVVEVCVSVNLAHVKRMQHKSAHVCTVVF